MEHLYVRDVMSRGVWCVAADAPLVEVAGRMREQAISCLIVSDGKMPLGIISERDLVRELYEILETGDPTRTAADVMSVPVLTTSPSESVFDAMREMVSRKIRRLAVVSSSGELLGVVTQTDLLRAQLAQIEARTAALAQRVTQRTQDLVDAAEKLKKSNRMRGQFLATMSHEIRTPLNGILGTVALLLDDELPDSHREQLETIADSGDALLAILNDVLDLSKIDAGELRIDERPFDLREVAQSVARLLDARAKERHNEIGVTVDANLPVVVGDAVRVRQVIQNFVSNAVKFTENGWIDIALSAHDIGGDRVKVGVEVRDTGMGMQAVDVERIFMAYQQAEGDADTRARGTGLGLTICHRLVDLMGGEIGVRSKHGAGSVFWMTLELERGTLVAVESPKPTREDYDGVTVLLVDDDVISRRIAVRTLERVGCVVTEAVNGLDAVQQLSSLVYDITFMDCEMPVLDGYEATEEVRRREARTRGGVRQHIVAMTGHALTSDREKCLRAGMDGYVTKPASRADLLAELDRIVSIERGAA